MLIKSARILVRIGYSLLILAAVAVTGFILLLTLVNLEDYRQSLEQRLTKALHQPVTIGSGSLTYSNGLALKLEDITIGEPARPRVTIPRLLATLELAPLLQRSFVLNQVTIEQPHIDLILPLQPQEERPERGTSQRIFTSLGISTLNIHDGYFNLYQRQKDQTTRRLSINNIHAALNGWSNNNTGHLVVSAFLPQGQADLLLETNLPSSPLPQIWRKEEINLNLALRRLIPSSSDSNTEAKPLDLTFSISGVPDEGVTFSGSLNDARSDEVLASLESRWTSRPQSEVIEQIDINLFGLPLTGDAALLRQEGTTHLAGAIEAVEFSLTPQFLQRWNIPYAEKLTSGTLKTGLITFSDSWPSGNKLGGLPHIESKLSLQDIKSTLPYYQQLKDFTTKLSLEKGQLSVSEGNLHIGDTSLNFSGKIDNLLNQPTIDFQATGEVPLAPLAAANQSLKKWGISGDLPLFLKLTGEVATPQFNLHSDLSGIAINHAFLLQKNKATNASFDASGQWQSGSVQLDQAALQLGQARITASGQLNRTSSGNHYNFKVAPFKPKQLTPYSTLLKRLDPSGSVETKLHNNKGHLEGDFTLNDAGAHLFTRVIADLRHVSGRAQFDRSGLSFKQIPTFLGQSRIMVDGRLENWKALTLDLTTDKLHADDLIFSDPDMFFHDVHGSLRIDKKGLHFAPLHASLKDKTKVLINGSLFKLSDPEIQLDIDAEKANVLDIISLFTQPQSSTAKTKPVATKTKFELKPVVINVAIDQGSLGNLTFSNARGVITDHKQKLTIKPLTFDSGKGDGDVYVEHLRTNNEKQLRVTGRVNKIKASLLHQDFFNSPGLIKGDLSGNFSVVGSPGERFWQEAEGTLSLNVTDGALRKFRTLAQVFSILNVSQIFAGQAPDMDKEGMPFDLLRADLDIGGGFLKTDNLTVNSEAMNLSMVGQQSFIDNSLDFTLGVMPLGTVDKVITSIPVAGWLLTGENKALITAYFSVRGTVQKPVVKAIPVESVSDAVLGVFKRTFKLPGKLVKDIGSIFKTKKPTDQSASAEGK